MAGIRVEVDVELPFWWLHAYFDGGYAGYCNCELKSEKNLMIADLEVRSCVQLSQLPLWKRLLGIRNKPDSLRGKGIGRALIETVLTKADTESIQSIHGYIVQKDIDEWDHLLDWYEKLGFEICEPDGKNIVPAVKMIKMIL